MRTANVIGWLTAPDHLLPPVDQLDLKEVAHLTRVVRRVGGRFDGGKIGFIPNDAKWLRELARIGDVVDSHRRSQQAVDPALLEGGLYRLRRHFASFDIYALAVATEERDHDWLKAFMLNAAHQSGRSGLFMIPDRWANQQMELEAPFPAVSRLTESVANWPGVVFWTRSGAVAFAQMDQVERLYFDLREAAGPDWRYGSDDPWAKRTTKFDDVLDRHESRRRRTPSLLHLSDLHFGTDEALRRQNYLAINLARLIKEHSIGRTVITGDLFNNPRERDALEFLNFRQALALNSGQDPVVIPGNHDQKAFGNFRWSLRQLSELEWSPVVVDDSLEAVFLCFDSSKDAVLAKGKVSSEQRLAVGNAYDYLEARRPSIRRFRRIALLHHHPFSFRVPSKGLWKAFETVGIDQERFLRMEGGDEFVEWCAHRRVGLILHGHKHVPFHRRDYIPTGDGSRKIDSVGCGSSTGAGGFPLSMNVVSWGADRLAVKFLVDPGDGRGFSSTLVKVHQVEASG